MYGCYIHSKDHAQHDMCDSGVYLRNIIHLFLVNQVSGLVENLNTGIFSDSMNVINLELCTMVLLIELHLFTPLSLTVTIFQGHRNVKLLELKN